MELSRTVFDKRQRTLISGLIRGIMPGTVPVQKYATKIQEILIKGGINVERPKINQQMFWSTNNQETFRAAYQVLLAERPDQLKELFNGQIFNQNFIGEPLTA